MNESTFSKLAQWCMPLGLALRRQEERNCKFEAVWVYKASFKKDWSTNAKREMLPHKRPKQTNNQTQPQVYLHALTSLNSKARSN